MDLLMTNQTVAKGIDPFAVRGFGKTDFQKIGVRLRSHCRDVGKIDRQCFRAEEFRHHPFFLEVNPLDKRIDRDDETASGRRVDDGGVIADADFDAGMEGCSSPPQAIDQFAFGNEPLLQLYG